MKMNLRDTRLVRVGTSPESVIGGWSTHNRIIALNVQ